jgi:hypothetical protein
VVCAPDWLGGGCVTITPEITLGPVTVSVGVSAQVTVQAGQMSVTVSASALGLTVSKTFSLGRLDPPGAAQVDPPPVLATKLADGTLRLNIGSYASARAVAGFTQDLDESFSVRHVSGTAGNETVTVDAFGFQQQFAGIRRILVADAGIGTTSCRSSPACALERRAERRRSQRCPVLPRQRQSRDARRRNGNDTWA